MIRICNRSVIMCRRAFSTVQAAAVPAVTPELVAQRRPVELLGSRHSRNARKKGLVPGIIYGVNAKGEEVKTPVFTDRRAVEAHLRKYGASFENVLFNVVLDDATYSVTPRQIQFDPVTEAPVNVNFLLYRSGIRVRIPIEFVNDDQCVDLRRGNCFLIQVNPFIECVCQDTVPATIQADLTNLQKGAVIRLSHLLFPPTVVPSKAVPSNFVAGVIRSSRK